MAGACLFLCVCLGQASGSDADSYALVSRLGAARFADREAATAALERIGRPALPALRSVRDQKDSEVRTRASGLIVRIESALLTRPTMVRLDYQAAPVKDVVRSLSERSGMRLELVPERSPAWADRTVTLTGAAAVPFWTAVDLLCDAAHLQYNYAVLHAGGRGPSFPLFEDSGRTAPPVCDSGPFRVSVVGIHFQRDVDFLAPTQVGRGARGNGPVVKAVPAMNEQFYAQLQVTAEPRLALTQAGQLRLTEAVDDRGQRLVTRASTETPVSHHVSGYFGFTNGPVVHLQAALTRPPQSGTTIKRLKGVIPLALSSRKTDPLVIPLASTGKTYRNDDAAVTVHGYTPPADHRPGTMELTLRPRNGAAAGSHEPGVRPDTYQQQIEVVDGLGRLVPCYQTGFDAEAGRLTLTIPTEEPGSSPAVLCYFGLIRATADVPFEFADLPLPLP